MGSRVQNVVMQECRYKGEAGGGEDLDPRNIFDL